MEDILNKYNFKKTEKDLSVFSKDYFLESINGDYGYYLHATLSIPKKTSNTDLEYNFSKLIIHRYKNYRERLDEYLADGESRVLYYGLIENEEDLKFILTKTGVISAGKKIKNK